jgi:hypothetical protein
MLGAVSFGGITFAAFDRGQHHAMQFARGEKSEGSEPA